MSFPVTGAQPGAPGVRRPAPGFAALLRPRFASARPRTVAAVPIGANRYFPEAADRGYPFMLPPENSPFSPRPAAALPAAGLELAQIENEYRKLLDNFRRIRQAVAGGRGDAPCGRSDLHLPLCAARGCIDLVDFPPTRGGTDGDPRPGPRPSLTLDSADMEKLRQQGGAGFPPARLRRRQPPAGKPARHSAAAWNAIFSTSPVRSRTRG